MGNRASSPTGTPAPTNTSEAEGDASGVFLSPGFQNKVLTDFQSRVLKEEWEKRQKYLLARGNQRRIENLKREEALEEQLVKFREQNERVQAQLNQRVDTLNARFADLSVALQHDVKRMEQTNANKKDFQETKPCLAERANVIECYGKKDPTECDVFVEALGRCVKKTVLSQ